MSATPKKVNLAEALGGIREYWSPHIAGELNGQMVKLVKFKNEFVWHHHDHEDELFYVVDGWFNMELEGKTIRVEQGEFIVIPRGVEHRPVAPEEVSVLLFEPATTLNTGNVRNDRTRDVLKRIAS